MTTEYEEILAQANAEVQLLTRQAKALIQEIMPNVVEVGWPKQKTIGYGVGPKKMSEQFCYIALFKNRINLGFYYGADLPDPDNLLEGTGKLLRHVKITDAAQLSNPALWTLIEAASKHLPRLKES